MVRLAFEVVALVYAGQRVLHYSGILACFELRLQSVPLGAAGDVYEGGHPVVGGEDVRQYRARLDVSRPTNEHRSAHAPFPRGQLAALEWRDAAVGVGLRLGAVVSREAQDGVV